MLIKRGFGITLDESLNAAEYLATEGNRKVVFGLRGMKTNMGDPHRNFVDFAHVPVVKRLTRMPVCIDPSHSVGTRAQRARRPARHLPRRRPGRHRRREHDPRRLPPRPCQGARRRTAGAAAVRAPAISSTTWRWCARRTSGGSSAQSKPHSDPGPRLATWKARARQRSNSSCGFRARPSRRCCATPPSRQSGAGARVSQRCVPPTSTPTTSGSLGPASACVCAARVAAGCRRSRVRRTRAAARGSPPDPSTNGRCTPGQPVPRSTRRALR